MIVHRLARPLIAAVFVISGIDILRNPEGRVKTAAPFLQSTVGKLEEKIEGLPARVPTDPETIVRADAAFKIVAGLGLALGKFPRLCAFLLALDLIPTTMAGHPYWAHQDPAARAQQRTHFLKNLGLFGGLVIAATSGGKRKKDD
ncbi:MAG TPA: DoxX family protein [Pseudonocardiaceae bacterium]|jgi:uncharacterized membrane protein YphA (DoxX/SURF4 family)|nr:DoxX family protein [Pseudonocardiaceae bacterium]